MNLFLPLFHYLSKSNLETLESCHLDLIARWNIVLKSTTVLLFMSDIKSHFTYILMLTEEKWWVVNNVSSNCWSSDYLAARPENNKTPWHHREILLMLFMCFQHSLMRSWAVKHTVFFTASGTLPPPSAVNLMDELQSLIQYHQHRNTCFRGDFPGADPARLLNTGKQKGRKKSLLCSLNAILLC